MTKTFERVLNSLTDRLKQRSIGENRDETGLILNVNAVLSVPVQTISALGTSLEHVDMQVAC